MRILVTGAAGMLGSGLVPALVRAGHEVTATDIDLRARTPWGPGMPEIRRLDVRRWDDVRGGMDRYQPELVCHLAALTDLEYCDAHESDAYATNTVGTKFAAMECRRRGIPMVYISTAGVFNGLKDTPYHEWDDPCPLNTYGKTKYEGELMVERFTDEHFIVRAGWMVGGGRNKDHKFVAKILKQIDDGSSRLYAVGDKFGTPTYVPDFAECFLGLIQSGSYGRYHMACEGRGSRLDVAKLIVKALGRDDIAVIDVTSDHFAAEYPSIRPRSEIMQNMHLQLQGLNTMRPWQEAVEEYVRSAFGESLIPRQSDPADGVVLTPVDVSVKEGV